MLRSFCTVRLCFLVVWTILSICISMRGDFSKRAILATTYAYPQFPETTFDGDPRPSDGRNNNGDEGVAIVVINNSEYSMPIGTEVQPVYSKQIADVPIMVQTAEIIRAPPNYGCFLSSTPEYLRRVYDGENLSKRKEPSSGDEDPIISTPFYSPETRFGSTSLVKPFPGAIILTCYQIFDRKFHYTIDDNADDDKMERPDTDESDILLVWLEFAGATTSIEYDANPSDMAQLITAGGPFTGEVGSSSSFDPTYWDPETHGYGSLHYILYRKQRGFFGERRFGEKFVGNVPALERAVVVHDPLALTRADGDVADKDVTNSNNIDDDRSTECLAVGKREGKKGDRTRDDYLFGAEKGVFYADKPLVGTFRDVNAILCYQGRRATGLKPEEGVPEVG